uniref:Alternative protein C18orf34 n=1 Tax=Homo sapiens TaxID=9606 RepID=L8EBH8_HUMAN|nr:alternative protein C18orf34 [Homo sapiens]
MINSYHLILQLEIRNSSVSCREGCTHCGRSTSNWWSSSAR